MKNRKQAVIIVCDSLRFDLIDEEISPTLNGLKYSFVQFTNMKGIFPTTTRVCAASIATGCLPSRHGLLGNTMVLHEREGLECFSVGKPDFVERLRRVTGRTLLEPTLAERSAGVGGCIVMSNVSAGAAYFQDPDGYGHVYHRAGSFGPGRKRLTDDLEIKIGIDGDKTMTRRFCREILEARSPAIAILWLSEPDHTGHHSQLGSPEHRMAIKAADACVKEVLDTVSRLDPEGENILQIVCSDHGMETNRRVINIESAMVQAGLKDSIDSREVVLAPQGHSVLIHFSTAAEGRISDVANWFLSQDFTGNVFRKEDFSSIGLSAVDSLGLVVAMKYESKINDHGVEGYSDVVASQFGSETIPGFGSHGGLGPHENSSFLFVKSPEELPNPYVHHSSLIDIAPTVLRHLGLPYDGMDGRPFQEDLIDV